jgi:putative pyruvate formate lyase activating enzyme
MIRILLLIFTILIFFSGCYINGQKQIENMNETDSFFTEFEPSYVKLQKEGILKQRGQELWERMAQCDLCPRNCGAKRLEGERGICKANSKLEISSYGPHFGEEPELVGNGGSGTIFFTNCALLCVFCINYDISQMGYGTVHSIEDLANIMLQLQKRGCHNINLVSPSHYIPHILLALDIASEKGLRIPIVYNSSGWEKAEVIKYLDKVVDIYLPDFKYGCNHHAKKYSIGASDYVERTQEAIAEMNRQVGVLKTNPKTGLAQRGLMIRHLVMPNNVSCSEQVFKWIAENLPKETYVNIMSQYTPYFKAKHYPEINRRITLKEYQDAVNAAKKAGLTNIKQQGY